jgi:ABC-2 type transport system permease protein
MAVFERRLRPWAGTPTPRRRRFLVVWRYARRQLFASRLVTALIVACALPPVVALLYIYLRYNLPALDALSLDLALMPRVDSQFFFYGVKTQGYFAFLLAVLVGPGLVAPDLANNALPLYLSRPLTRAEYVLGKLTVLLTLLSAVTWVPMAALVLVEAGLDDAPGLAGQGRNLVAVIAGGAVWVVVVSLAALAVSAWVRWKTLAAALLVASFFVTRALAVIVDDLFATRWGGIVDPSAQINAVWQWLFWGAGSAGSADLPPGAAWLGLGLLAGVCVLLLDKKLRACEVVR